MRRPFLRSVGAAAVLACGVAVGLGLGGSSITSPVAAQGFSDGFEFLKAVKDRDGDAATAFLNEPGNTIINSRDITSGETGLHIVTARRDVLWVRFLLQRGANPNIRDKKGITPLQLATTLGFVDGIEELIKRGAQVDVSDRAGETPLIAAVHRRDTGIIRLLLAQGADPDRNDNSGRSARDYVELMNSNSAILAEFTRADKEREEKGTDRNYGPSF